MNRSVLIIALSAFAFAGAGSTVSAAVLAYEGFDYPNDPSPPALVEGLNGGTGWGGPWAVTGGNLGGALAISQDDVSMTSTAFPFTPTGDRVLGLGPGGTAGNVYRVDRPLGNSFDLNVDGGTLYASFLFQKTTGAAASNDNQEFVFVSSGGSQTVRIGSTSAEQFFIFGSAGVPGTANFEAITLGQTYFVVAKLESHMATDDVASVIVYSPSETVPTTEPVAWDKTHSLNSTALISALRIGIGRDATAGEWDEIRVGQTWADVTHPAIALHPGDFNGDGDVDGGDFVAWQSSFPKQSGATPAEGDADGDGDVDGADFVVWQTNFPFGPGASAISIPEPGSIILTIFGISALVTGKRMIGKRRFVCLA